MSLNIRSITLFESECSGFGLKSDLETDYPKLLSTINKSLNGIRTLRCTLPVLDLMSSSSIDEDLVISNRKVESRCKNGFRWVNQPLLIRNFSSHAIDNSIINSISSLVSSRDTLFSSLIVNNYDDIEKCSMLYSTISKSIARFDRSGFGNFRFGVGFNLNPSTPFFPFSYSFKFGFSVAVESYSLIYDLWNSTKSFSDLSSVLSKELQNLNETCEKLSLNLNLPFLGIDCSLAPLPNSSNSVCALIESIAGVPIGSPGILSVIEKLTQTIKLSMKSVKSAGFNGVMLSVLEDDILAKRLTSGHVTINDLILYSSVCGCGLDMIPICGSTSNSALANLCSDVGHMAFRLNKPLGVRMLAMHGMRTGEETQFYHDFVTNSVVSKL